MVSCTRRVNKSGAAMLASSYWLAEDEILEDKKCEIIKILQKQIPKGVEEESDKEGVIDFLNISKNKVSLSENELANMEFFC